jgi:tetratricopeptide (TPR) repeat protein
LARASLTAILNWAYKFNADGRFAMLRSVLILSLLVSIPAIAQHHHSAPAKLRVEMYTGLGGVHHPVSTQNAQAQKYFDQGLALLYGFNHEEAAKAFSAAAKLDPNLAIAHWGVALVNGQNYNAPEFPELLKIAKAELTTAQSISSKASPGEQALIGALAKRYDDSLGDAKSRERAYSEAMGEVSAKFPDDLDVATLYAESLMNLTPWQLWTKDGQPGPNTEKVIAILESVLRRNPQHIGANHYYIHAVEASPNPARGIASANRLRDLKLSAGHLVHMPGHIYLRTGDYPAAAAVNVAAANADMTYIQREKIKPGIYSMMYYSHNLHFLALADSMAGRYASSRAAADKLSAHVGPAVKGMPMVESFLPVKTYVLVRFGKWSDMLAMPEPDKSLRLHHAMWHWGRGMAYVATGNTPAAEKEESALDEARTSAPADAMVDKNSLATVLSVASHMLAARIAGAKGNLAEAEKHYDEAAQLHDNFNYIEPPEWPFPVRESHGAMLLRAGRAADAEKVFRADLERFPRNGRSLFGLVESLKAQGNNEAARLVEMEFKDAWKQADTKLSVNELEIGTARQPVAKQKATTAMAVSPH